MTAVNQQALDVIFNHGRSHNVWLDKPVADDLLKQVYDLTKMAPTSANCQPLRVIFVKSPEMKEKLKPAIAGGNVDKVMTAPVTAILGMDMEFYNHLPKLFPHADARSWFAGNDALIESTAFRNSSMQGGYFLLAARALGLDTGALSGFDNAKVDQAFFAGTKIKSNFLCNLGYGDYSKLFPASPRSDFDDFCKII
jgi:3-hydroxypropanoate dehydrogenase